uniref:Uncharacterized protein n=1 Tax=Mycena chlorophos TaxID=658473 RepID=A0ABQ0M3L8_MYCCL|nr:predicted protein [Mycena chlorophos]
MLSFRVFRRLVLGTITTLSATNICLSLYIRPAFRHPNNAYIIVGILDALIFAAIVSMCRKSWGDPQTVAAEALGLVVTLPFALILVLYTLGLSVTPDFQHVFVALQWLLVISTILHTFYCFGLAITAAITVCAFDYNVWSRDIDSSPSPFPMTLVLRFILPCIGTSDTSKTSNEATEHTICLPGCNCPSSKANLTETQPEQSEMRIAPSISSLVNNIRSPTPSARYACTSLKSCLDAICRSSPELIQDRSRDWSVYLMDPLEADCAPAQPSKAHHPDMDPNTVAVGLGLMSWALVSEEPVTANGTLKASAAGLEMLELVFSLRSTVPMEKAALPETVRTWSLPPPTNATEAKKPTKYAHTRSAPQRRAAPATLSDAFLSQDIYIGPERPPLGRRPRSNTTEKRKHTRKTPLPDAQPQPASEPPAPSPPQLSPDPPPPPAPPTPLSAEDQEKVLNFLAALGSDEQRNQMLSSVLSLMNASGGASSPELIKAVSSLSSLQPPPPTAPVATTFSRSVSQPEGVALLALNAHRKSTGADEIVPLNKENVNPALFQRRGKEPSPLGAAWSEPNLSNPTNQPPLPLARKRTFSQLSDHGERPRVHYYRQPEQALAVPPGGPVVAASSPGPSSRPMAPPPRPIVSASSPVQTLVGNKMPAWAITNTATQPRLSEDALQRVQQRRQQKELEDREAKDARRKRARESKLRLKEGGKGRANTAPVQRAVSGPTTPLRSTTNNVPLPGPIAAVTGFSLLVGLQTPRNNSASSLPRDSPTTPKNASTTPCTPPRKRANTAGASSGPNSLFTPAEADFWDGSGLLGVQRTPVSPSCRKAEETTTTAEAEDSAADDLLDQELDSAFEELSSSCPVASGDDENENDNDNDNAAMDEYETETDEEVQVPPKQHWEGLPPSSPPPPSSPYIPPAVVPPSEDDGAAFELELEPASEPESSAPVGDTSTFSLAAFDDFLSMDPFSVPVSACASGPTTTTTADNSIFDEFLTNMGSDDSQTIRDWSGSFGVRFVGTENDLGLDFNEFLNVSRPLLEAAAGSVGEGFGLGVEGGDEGMFDAAKAAESMHALLHDCVV